ncbi:MAG: hypothetical protein COZ18_12005 [Flexibacter sp. CG_4_10_14_3_um_filter_32_15]|nr:MAG: hypothetical protein COZ18_12005 [Flexibacter sp. CG_4_10_14_3_um_filter_32_15]
MKIFLQEAKNNKTVEALISLSKSNELPLQKEGWLFNWKKLAKEKGAMFYKLTTSENPHIIEGMLMLTLIDEEMIYMNNIEVAPHNYGKQGKFDNVAGSLIAFACYKGNELGKNGYIGFVSFDSKTELADLYQKKYGATPFRGTKMFFEPKDGKALIKKYLLIDF